MDTFTVKVAPGDVVPVDQKRQRITTSFQVYQTSKNIDSHCIDITFINQGTAPVTLNNVVVLTAGQSVSISAELGQIDVTDYYCVFDVSNPALIASLLVLKRNYVD